MKVKRKSFLDGKRKCVFVPRKLWRIAKKGVGLPTEEAFKVILKALDEEYPGYIDKDALKRGNWVFNNAGNAMGQMLLLHGSLREYIIFFGTCQGNEGHSGRYSAEVYDFMFKGEMLCEYEGRFKPEVHKAGSPAYLPSSIVKHYCIKEEGWMLEYSRGNITSMLPFGLADTILSTLDYMTLFKTIYYYGRLVVKNLFKNRKDLDIVLKWLLILLIPLIILAISL